MITRFLKMRFYRIGNGGPQLAAKQELVRRDGQNLEEHKFKPCRTTHSEAIDREIKDH